MTVRWRFYDLGTDEEVILPLNPNSMTTPTTARTIEWGWGSQGRDGSGVKRLRGISTPVDQAGTWQFGGVILTKAHYDLLLAWAGRLALLRVQDHLGRRFKVVIQKFDPVERLPTATKPWRADYQMTCLLLERLADA